MGLADDRVPGVRMAFAALLPLLRRICLPDADTALLTELDAASGRLAADVDRNVAAITAIDSELQVWELPQPNAPGARETLEVWG